MTKFTDKIQRTRPGASNTSWQMSAADVRLIADHYNKKQIKIYKNGETALGQQRIDQRKAILALRGKEVLSKFQSETRYIEFIIERAYEFPSPLPTCKVHLSEGNYRLIHRCAEEFLNGHGNVKELTTHELQLNRILEKNKKIKEYLDSLIQAYQREEKYNIAKAIANTALSLEEAWEEVRYIQQTLKKAETVGYIYTNGANTQLRHFEVVIITSETIIKPINWYQSIYSKTFHPLNVEEMAEVKLDSQAILNSGLAKIPSAQSDKLACGTLGFMYAKELLKDNARQLKEFTLRIPYYDTEGNQSWFFYPSPQVLRYSQSLTYNKLLLQMLVDDEQSQEYVKDGNTYQIVTLKGLLQTTAKIAREEENYELATYCKQLLANLADFRSRWLKNYKESSKIRKSFYDNGGINQYLSYASRRMRTHVMPEFLTWEHLSLEDLLGIMKEALPETSLNLPLSGERQKALFGQEEFWLVKLKEHFPDAQPRKGQTAFECLWSTYTQEYKNLSLEQSKLFSLAKVGRLTLRNITEDELILEDSQQISLMQWMVFSGDQQLLQAVDRKFPDVNVYSSYITEDLFQKLVVNNKWKTALSFYATQHPIINYDTLFALQDNKQDLLLKMYCNHVKRVFNSFEKLINFGDTGLAQICSLLEDYTKGHSSISRIFPGHWNRHYTKEVAAIIKQINENTSVVEVLALLDAINFKKGSDSLILRMQYMKTIIVTNSVTYEPLESLLF